MKKYGIALLFIMLIVFLPGNAQASMSSDEILAMDSTYEGFLKNDAVPSFAELCKMDGTTVTAEYDILNQNKRLSNSELKTQGISSQEINELRQYSTAELVGGNAQSLSDEELIQRGVSVEGINCLRNKQYNLIKEKDLRAMSAQLAFNIASPSRAGTSANFVIYWHWDSQPLKKYQDVVSASISDGYVVTGQSTCKLTYQDWAQKVPNTTKRISPSGYAGGQTYFVFPMKAYYSTGPQWCRYGKAFISTTGTVVPPVLGAAAQYFHTIASDKINIGITIRGITISGPEGSRSYASLSF